MKTLEKHPFFSDPVKAIEELLIERKSKNRSYSATALARDLGLSQAYLSQVMNRKRKLSVEQQMRIGEILGISYLRPTPAKSKPFEFEVIQNTLEQEKILKHWYHFAILELSQTRKLSDDPSEIAQILGISEIEARTATERLIAYGYLARQNKRLRKTKLPFVFDAKQSSKALRELHQSRLDGARQELERFTQPDVESRHFETLFIPSSRKKIERAKKLLYQFQKNLIRELMEDDPDEVFQLSLQLFSIETKSKKRNPHENEN